MYFRCGPNETPRLNERMKSELRLVEAESRQRFETVLRNVQDGTNRPLPATFLVCRFEAEFELTEGLLGIEVDMTEGG